MLPRFKQGYSTDLIAMEKKFSSNLCSEAYPDIIRERKLFKDDGVHLAPVANNIFLQTLQGGIEHFISGLGKV